MEQMEFNTNEKNKKLAGKLNRRKFLRLGGATVIASGLGYALVACGEEQPGGQSVVIVPGVGQQGTAATPSPGSDLTGIPPTAIATATSAGSTPFGGATTAPAATTAAPAQTTAAATAGNPIETATAFLKAWEESRFNDMYGMLTTTARNTINQENFVKRYTAITAEATIQGIETKLGNPEKPIQPDTILIEFPFNAKFKTGRVGEFSRDNKLPVKSESGAWKIDWSPGVIIPELEAPGSLVRMVRLNTERGQIYSRGNEPLSAPAPLYEVYVVPGQIQNEQELLSVLSQRLGMTPEKVKAAYQNGQPDWRMPIKSLPLQAATPEVLGALQAVKGVGVDESSTRSYPQGTSAAHVVGYISAVNADDLKKWAAKGYTEDDKIGRTGVEAGAEELLAGEKGGKLTIIRRDSSLAATLGERPSRPGSNVFLNLDLKVQRAAEAALGQKVGSAVAMEVNTGAVLALASFPSYDPNGFIFGLTTEQFNALNNDPRRPFSNRALNGLLPIGSVFKAFTSAAALEYLGVDMNTRFTCTGRWTGLGASQAKNCYLTSGHGSITLFEGFVQSCDVVYYELGKRLNDKDPALLAGLTKAFGLGAATGITGIADSAGQVPDPKWKQERLQQPWVPGDGVNLAIGQGYLLSTPLQVAVAYAAFANGGKVMQPRLVERAESSDPNGNRSFPPVVKATVPVKPETLVEVQKAMVGVTTRPLGTARTAFAGSKVSVGGKTGTAESGVEQPHAWFACYAPANQPRYAVVVAMENGGFGNEVAAPIARKIVDALPF
jgi:penicillin-binding protein 2